MCVDYTFCLCIILSRSPKGDSSGLSNANKASVLSISVRHSRLSSPSTLQEFFFMIFKLKCFETFLFVSLLFCFTLKRNYTCMKPFVESQPYAPMQQQWLDSMIAQIPPHLKEGPKMNKLLQQLCGEVTDELHRVIVKLTGTLSFYFSSLDCFQLCHSTFTKRQRIIKRKLHILHHVMQTISALSYRAFTHMVLVEPYRWRSLEPVDCKHLQRSAATECERKEAEIMNTWFPPIIHILTDAETLEGLKVEQLDSFYNCASTLMSNQLKSMLQQSVKTFVSAFDPNNRRYLPIFCMNLTFDDEKMEMYPSLQDLEASVLEILSSIASTLQRVQTVQAWLAPTSTSYVNASIPDDILAWARVTVTNAVRKNLEEPDKHYKTYVKNYDWLVNGTAQTQVDTFLNEEHSFDEYTKVKIPKDEPISFYVWLNHVLVYLLLYATLPIKANTCHQTQRAKSAVRLLLKICSEFETINKKALEVPEDTDAIANMIDYINRMFSYVCICHIMHLQEASTRLLYLLDVYNFEPEDLELNSAVFLWQKKIHDAFELNDEVLLSAKQKREGELIAKREKLLVELEKLRAMVEQLNCSSLDMMEQSFKVVKMIQKNLRKAEEAVALINKEETFYKWDRTSYPEVEVIKEEIDTYHKLFGLILKWQDAESSRWMDGSFLDINGETVETQVDEFYREIFKLLRFFQQKQNKAAQELEKMSGITRERSAEDDQGKQENPIVALCSAVVEQIKKFKVFKNCCHKMFIFSSMFKF
uniref:Uncharacterized protein n=1 Tax=Cyprinodon variegatus TaxID=28743 RepID=A0A3Q2D0D5_CYPVA